MKPFSSITSLEARLHTLARLPALMVTMPSSCSKVVLLLTFSETSMLTGPVSRGNTKMAGPIEIQALMPTEEHGTFRNGHLVARMPWMENQRMHPL